MRLNGGLPRKTGDGSLSLMHSLSDKTKNRPLSYVYPTRQRTVPCLTFGTAYADISQHGYGAQRGFVQCDGAERDQGWQCQPAGHADSLKILIVDDIIFNRLSLSSQNKELSLVL